MSKRWFLILTTGGVLLLLVGFGLVVWQKGLSKVVPEAQEKLPFKQTFQDLSSQKTEELVLYEDEAGFSFQHPATVGVIEQETSASDIYTLLELSGKEHPGQKMSVKVADTAVKTPEQYLKQSPSFGDPAKIEEFSLGKMKGKVFTFSEAGQKLAMVVDEGVFYSFQFSSGSDFWDKTLYGIASSFRFTEEKSNSSAASVIEEGEDIIE